METGWLLDDGQLCIGGSWHGFTMCTYSDERAIRFAREEDAERMRNVLRALGSPLTAAHVHPVELAWCDGRGPQELDT